MERSRALYLAGVVSVTLAVGLSGQQRGGETAAVPLISPGPSAARFPRNADEFDQIGPWPVSRNEAGYHASVAPWLKARGVAFLASDDAQDVTPSLVEGITLPVHTLAITALGVDILDNQDLEAVADTAEKLKRWEFLLMVAPVPVIGGTGFPANALAVF